MPHKSVLGIVGAFVVLLPVLVLGFGDTRSAASIDETPAPIAQVVSIVVSTSGSAGVALGRAAPATPLPIRSAATSPAINGIPISRILVLPDSVKQHIRSIHAQGRALGRNPRAFSKVGDSTMAWPPFLAAFDDDTAFRLGPYAYLAPTIAYYSGSFSRTSLAVRKGMHTWTEFDPSWVDSDTCLPGEGPLACELRANKSSVALIRLGANDTYAPARFEEEMQRIVEYCLKSGVIPVLGTKPDRQEGSANTLNKSVQRLAQKFNVPLWDYDRVAATIPGKGLEEDKVHFRGIGSHDFLSSKAFASADSLEDLTGLLMLDAVSRELGGLTDP